MNYKQVTNEYSQYTRSKRCPLCNKTSLIRVYSSANELAKSIVKLQDLTTNAFAECPRCSRTFPIFEKYPQSATESDLQSIKFIMYIIEKLFSGEISIDEVKERFQENTDTLSILQAFAGKEILTPSAMLSFGSGLQMGDLKINNLVGGHMISITVNIQNRHEC